MQALEDSDLLAPILHGDLCTHYRIHSGNQVVFYAYLEGTCRVCEEEKCRTSLSSSANVTLATHYRDTFCVKSHDLCYFFEQSKIPYKLVDVINEG